MAKRYYWLKLMDDFFDSKRIKKLRRIAGGDTYTIIYLKIQLLAMKTDGVITWSGLEESFAKELALDLDEQEENVEVVLAYLISCGLAETSDSINFYFPYAVANTGSEGSSTQRVREFRNRQALQCNTNVTQCNNSVTESKSKRIEIDIDKDIESKPAKRFVKPTLEEVTAYCQERNNNVNPQKFIDYYESNGWKVGKNSMKDWKAAVRNWENSSYQKKADKPDGNSNSSFDTDNFFEAVMKRSYE